MTYTPKHTTEEYLAWIDNKLEILKEPLTALEVIYFAGLTNSLRISLLANRDVLVRHEENSIYGISRCKVCIVHTGIGHPLMTAVLKFPCPTYLDIAQRLDEVM